MNRTLLVCSLSLSLVLPSAFAKDRPDSDYQDGLLVGFRTMVTGTDCTSRADVKGSISDSGDVKGDTTTKGSCANNNSRVYTVKIGENTFEIAALPVSWNRADALEKQLPGYRFRVRSEKGKFFIKIDKRETAFEIREAR